MSRGERDEELALFHDMHKKEGDRKSNAVHPLMSNGHDELSFVKLTGSSKPYHMASSAATVSIAALKSNKTGDDLLTTDLGKNDYDWLLTPPGTPLMNPPDLHTSPAYGEDFLSHAVLPNLVRSLAAIKTSRLSSFKSEPIMKREGSNGTLFSMRPDPGMRSGRNGMIRSNSAVTAGSSLTANNMTARRTPAAPGSRPTSRPTTPTKRSATSSTPASRPTTPTSRPKAPASAPMHRPETPTNRSRAAPTPASRPSTPSNRATITPFSRNTENNAMSSSSASKGNVPSHSTTPLRRPITPQAQPQSVSAAATRSSSITKQRPVPSRSTPSSRGSSPTIKPNAWQQLSDIPGFSLEPPPNLRTSLPARPSSNSRGASVSTSRPGTASTGNGVATSLRALSDLQSEKAHDAPARRPSSPMAARGRAGTFSSLTGERQSSMGSPMMRSSGRFDRSPSESVVKGTKVVDKMIPSRKPFPSSLSPETALSMSQIKHAARPGTPTANRDNTGFGRSTPRKSTELPMRHMEPRQTSTTGLRSIVRNTPTSSLYSVRPAGMRGLMNSSPMATSSNASSDYSMSIVRDPEGSELGEEFTTSEAGSKASPADSLSSVVKNPHMHSWLGSPEYKDGTPESITQSTPEANQDLENLASSELCLVCRHGCVPANCDLCNMKIRLQKLNEKCRASLRASLHPADAESHIDSPGNGNLKMCLTVLTPNNVEDLREEYAIVMFLVYCRS
ncbi:hypothetical protein GOP47_0004867 [Adiantum capillus-veneris]|uniref:Uncharacterized protein n=1 Tax=Adiantum capillus-veneris TaxID=13818 RepID=A0A9D4ZKV1_ADICA|nr:hypothetical protein GOP47_0004867 [Adiantum capillus-veneris]